VAISDGGEAAINNRIGIKQRSNENGENMK